MLARGEFVPTGGEIDRRVDLVLVQGIELRPHQVEVETRMDLPDLGRMVGPAVMAFREDGHRIDVGLGKRAGKIVRVEAEADPRIRSEVWKSRWIWR